jgi:hypothetical protein
VGDIEQALAFYARIFEFELRGKSDSMAFIDLGDQFIALQKGRTQAADAGRHVGLVVDDKAPFKMRPAYVPPCLYASSRLGAYVISPPAAANSRNSYMVGML